MIEYITQISTLIGILVAIYGINSWRREHIWRKRSDTAEEALALMYEASDVIDQIRHPISFSSEYGDIERGKSETEEQWQARKNANIAFARYNKHQELFNKLHAMRYRFMAQFGAEKAKPIVEIRHIVNEILAAANALSRLWPRNHFHSDKQQQEHRERVDKYEAIFWSMIADEDEIANRVKRAITLMEETVSAEIQGKGTLYSALNWRPSKQKN